MTDRKRKRLVKDEGVDEKRERELKTRKRVIRHAQYPEVERYWCGPIRIPGYEECW